MARVIFAVAPMPYHAPRARELEARLGKPTIGHDIALYWRMMKNLKIAPATPQGHLLERLHA